MITAGSLTVMTAKDATWCDEMFVSTRGMYALRVIIDLAEHEADGYTAMRKVAERQNISLKYLEKILPVLVSEGILHGVHGKGGGYRLARRPEEIKVGDVIHLTDGDLVTVACVECNSQPCEKTSECRTKPMWNELNHVINDYLDGVTIADLMM